MDFHEANIYGKKEAERRQDEIRATQKAKRESFYSINEQKNEYAQAERALEKGELNPLEFGRLTALDYLNEEELKELSKDDNAYQLHMEKQELARRLSDKATKILANSELDQTMEQAVRPTTEDKMNQLAKDDKAWDRFMEADKKRQLSKAI